MKANELIIDEFYTHKNTGNVYQYKGLSRNPYEQRSYYSRRIYIKYNIIKSPKFIYIIPNIGREIWVGERFLHSLIAL